MTRTKFDGKEAEKFVKLENLALKESVLFLKYLWEILGKYDVSLIDCPV